MNLFKSVLMIAGMFSFQACCPFPMQKPLIPEGEIIVRHHANQTAIQGAQVMISRGDRHPHQTRITHEWDLMTDTNGSVQTKASSHYEWLMPLMMHGVPFYYWRVCVSKPGYRTAYKYWAYETDKSLKPFVVALVPGDHTPCPIKSVKPRVRKDQTPTQPTQESNPVIQIKNDGTKWPQLNDQ